MVCHVESPFDAENHDVDCWNTLGSLGERLAPKRDRQRCVRRSPLSLSSPISGLAAIDDCVGVGGCAVNGCGTPSCNTNTYFTTWPNYPNCGPGTSACTKQPGLPSATGCGTSLVFTAPNCGVSNAIAPTLWECGPCPMSSSGGCCNPGDSPVICCLNMAAFAFLCASCNPLNCGLVYVSVD
jgi:hypothetical protein